MYMFCIVTVVYVHVLYFDNVSYVYLICVFDSGRRGKIVEITVLCYEQTCRNEADISSKFLFRLYLAADFVYSLRYKSCVHRTDCRPFVCLVCLPFNFAVNRL